MLQNITKALILSLIAFSLACQNNTQNTANTSATSDTSQIDESRAPATQPSDLLDGKWRSNDDDQYLIHFTGNYMVSYYGKEVTSKEQWEYQAECSDSCNDLDGSCLLAKGEMDASCYYIIKLSKQDLQMSMVGGRGNTLSFTKIS